MTGMIAPETLLVRRPDDARLGLDQRPLFELGMAQVRAYARHVWSDHNIHDPGVTVMEQLSYALTDICRRSAFPLEDLLATETNNAQTMAGQFFAVDQALPNRPVSVRDYRKLVIDVGGVRNAWIFPRALVYYADPVKGELRRDKRANDRYVSIRGLNRVLVDHDEKSGLAWTDVERNVRRKLSGNRNLCQDFVEVTRVPTQAFILCTEVDLAPDADTAQVLAEIWFVTERYLAPPVRIYTREAFLAERRRPDGSRHTDPELFDGPLLDYGFIDNDELDRADLRGEIRLSDVISEVMDIPGVRAVRDMIIRPADEDEAEASAASESKWRIGVNPGARATLERTSSRVVLYKGGMPVQPLAGTADLVYDELEDAERATMRPAFWAERPPIPLGRPRRIERYTSLQQHFPAIYGIGEAGLPAGTTPAREAQAEQLRGYLLHFDQLMANAAAQIANVRVLFSRDPAVDETYFQQKIESLETLYLADAIELETEAQMLERRARFLDHLIARTGERLKDHLAVAASAFDGGPAAAVRARCRFLEEYPDLAGRRGQGYDYTASAGPDNASGLEERLRHLLGLGAIVHEAYAELASAGAEHFRFNVRNRSDDRVLLRATDRYDTRGEALVALELAVELARLPVGYEGRQATDGRWYFSVVEGGATIARGPGYYADQAAMNAAITELQALLHEHFSERLVVIENVLLLPDAADEPFLRICPDPGCTDCEGFDPYSFRLHIVLPVGAGRFRDMNFRRYAEKVIRDETPAHILAKICWLDDEAMAEVEQAWRAWMAVLDGSDANASRPARLARLEKALFESKGAYPEQRLHDCDAPESQPKFILGRSALGSAPGDGPNHS